MMKCTIRNLGLVLAASLALTGTTRAAERAAVNRRTGLYELPMADLRKAAERGDRAELARLVARLGPARLAKALQDSDRRTVLAALDSVPLLGTGILLLEGILPLLASTDETIRAHAVAASAALLAANDGASLADWEVAGEAQATCQALALLAARETEPLSTRLLAIQGLADAPAVCAAARKTAELLAASREPEIRRAAVLGLLPSSVSIAVLVAAAQDRNSGVAAAAGARLCERAEKNQSLPKDPPLRKLALADGALPEDIIGMLPCLAASADPADVKAMEDLKSSGAASVREAASHARDKKR